MSEVIAHGYLGMTAPDLEEWRIFATETLGLAVASGSNEDRLRLRMDKRAWRFEVTRGTGGLAFCGWEVANAQALLSVSQRLEDSGYPVKEDLDLAKERGVRGLVRTTDPGGTQVEFFYGAAMPPELFVSPSGASFVTTSVDVGDLGFGHAVVTFPDSKEALRFYVDVLGFRVTDWIAKGSNHATFLHVNARHHSLAFTEVPGVPSRLNHFMLEVKDIDMVGRALDAARAYRVEGTSALGRHANDWMLSFYTRTPSGFNVEYGTGARLIDDRFWTTTLYTRGSLWGHTGRLSPNT